MTAPAPSAIQLAVFVLGGLGGSSLVARGAFAAGIALLAASVMALRLPVSVWAMAEPAEPSPRTTWLSLAVIAAVAAFFRTYRLVPPGLWGDDALNGLLALDVVDGKISSPYQLIDHAFSRFHALSNYLIAASFQLFGPGLASLRVPGVVLNFVCVLLMYGIFAPLFGARIGLCAALFFATSPMQILHAKILIQAMAGEFFVLLAMFFFVRGLYGSRRWLTALAGPPLGLALCTYHATRLAPLIPLVLVAALCRAEKRERLSRLGWSTLALVLMVVTAAPGYLIYLEDPGALTGRIEGTSIFSLLGGTQGLRPLWLSLARTLGAFHYQQGPVIYHWFGIGTDPALTVVVAFLCLHGAVESVWRCREPRHILLLAWFGIGLIAGIFSTEAPRIYRVLLSTPPLFVWAAMPVVRLLAVRPAESRASTAAPALAAFLLLAVPLVDFNYYFYRVYTHPAHLWLQGSRLVDMARTLAERGPGWSGYLISSGFDSNQETLRFLQRIWSVKMRDVVSLAEVMPVQDESDVLIIVDPSAGGVVPALEEYYTVPAEVHRRPEARAWWFDGLISFAEKDEPGPMATYVAVPSQLSAAKRRVAEEHGWLADYRSDTKRIARLEPWPWYQFFRGVMDERYSVRWRGRLLVPEGGRKLRMRARSPLAVSIDGEPGTADAQLPAGEHDMAVELKDVQGPVLFEVFWQGDQRLERVPRNAFLPPRQ